MHVINAANVNEAYVAGLELLKKHGQKQGSRAGEVFVLPTPVTTVYHQPMQRVLFDSRRDANPFFHLMEALWMLAGRHDAKWLDQFVKDFSSRFAEEDGIQHGAYGWRWRNHYRFADTGIDQLDQVVRILKENPDDRRAVIQMWDPVNDLGAVKRDVPCNICVLPRIRNEPVLFDDYRGPTPVLDITVCCRSNDAIWGAYGANAVHFSVLQEYLARRIGVCIGKYYQISNNFHVYSDQLRKVTNQDLMGVYSSELRGFQVPPVFDPYNYCEQPAFQTDVTPIVTDPDNFDADLELFFADKHQPLVPPYKNQFFVTVAEPMWRAANAWRAGNVVAAQKELCVMSPRSDWRIAATQWLGRRVKS